VGGRGRDDHACSHAVSALGPNRRLLLRRLGHLLGADLLAQNSTPWPAALTPAITRTSRILRIRHADARVSHPVHQHGPPGAYHVLEKYRGKHTRQFPELPSPVAPIPHLLRAMPCCNRAVAKVLARCPAIDPIPAFKHRWMPPPSTYGHHKSFHPCGQRTTFVRAAEGQDEVNDAGRV